MELKKPRLSRNAAVDIYRYLSAMNQAIATGLNEGKVAIKISNSNPAT
ncbi:MAG: hypothetical protein KatS3mg101_0255 [Patescibacteria group bacterium]|nr:MAG: hypothetical protein KatS3mg101_0255 [Patescibacteria group bacterium]